MNACKNRPQAVNNKRFQNVDSQFVGSIETWGSGGQMIDVVVLKDGRIVAILEDRIDVYDNRADFDAGRRRALVKSAAFELSGSPRGPA